MDEITKEEQKTLTRIYETEEELNQLKVLAMVLQKNDLIRMGDVAIDVLKINSQNLLAKMAYELDVKSDVVINGLTFFSFNTWIMEDFLSKITANDPIFEEESLNIIVRTLSAFLNLLAFSKDCSDTLFSKVFKCFNSLHLGRDVKTAFYRTATTFFCNYTVLTALKNSADADINNISYKYFTANDILKIRKVCLIMLKQKIYNDTDISEDAKRSLTIQIANTGLTAPVQSTATQEETPKNRKIAYIGLGVLVVAAFIGFILLFI